ncbi:MAG: response regulator transcription factor [Nisaea sp.]|uniref:helix-turn-helix transcriptional regulator n=1 Tax=Nisaea sp. TaxID=2024842 RepID=UPI001B06EE98|nr:LuxR C-terminal-related transcriptional regulator [Nisaea sp.]MBO6559520.1 response regulator transcription factor [Nisaea sp.]
MQTGERPEPTGKSHPRTTAVIAAAASLLACMLFFAFDVVWDLREHLGEGSGYGTGESVHLAFEILAVVGLGYGAWLLRGYVVFLRRETDRNQQTIASLRGSFEQVLSEKFDGWNLTPAEKDVTLLIIKGLSINDIAGARNTAPGTVKAQSSSIFRKIGVSSRTELMSSVLDEFIDVANVET